MQRTAVVHYLGNRGEVMDAVVEHLCDQWRAFVIDTYLAVSPDRRLDTMLRIGFEGGNAADREQLVLTFELMLRAVRDPAVGRHVDSIYDLYLDVTREAIAARFPTAPEADRRAVAHSIVLLLVSLDLFSLIQPADTTRRASGALAVRLLLDSLEAGATGVAR